jgi:cytochrome b561
MKDEIAAKRYDAVTRILHWVMALLIAGAWLLASVADDYPKGPERQWVMDLHRSVGVMVFALVILRIVWRRLNPPPALPAATPALVRRGAAAGHIVLYVLMLALPAIGIALTWAAGRPVTVFGLFTLPPLFGANHDLKEVLEEVHAVLGNGILVVAGLHAAAALFHQYVLKDGVLGRMLPWPAGSRAKGMAKEMNLT